MRARVGDFGIVFVWCVCLCSCLFYCFTAHLVCSCVHCCLALVAAVDATTTTKLLMLFMKLVDLKMQLSLDLVKILKIKY